MGRRFGVGSICLLLTVLSSVLAHANDPIAYLESESLSLAAGGEAVTIKALEGGATYQVRVLGSFSYLASSGRMVHGDAECSTSSSLWTPAWTGGNYTTDHVDTGDVALDRRQIDWLPSTATEGTCSPSAHDYYTIFIPDESGPLAIKHMLLSGPTSGSFQIRIWRLSSLEPGAPGSEPPPAPATPSPQRYLEGQRPVPIEEVRVPPNQTGSSSANVLKAGQVYTFVANGTFRYDTGALADAECTGRLGGLDRWSVNRGGTPEDLWDTYVNGAPVDWQSPRGPHACDAQNHTYIYQYIPNVDGKAKFAVRDNLYSNNGGFNALFGFNDGFIYIDIYLGPATQLPARPELGQIEEVPVPSDGANVTSNSTLLAGTTYEFIARGTFYGGPNLLADAECTIGSTWMDDQYSSTDPGSDVLDVYVNGGQVTWVPARQASEGGNVKGLGRDLKDACDSRTHVYSFEYTPTSNGPASFNISDSNYADNSGTIFIEIRRGTSSVNRIRLLDTISVPSTASAGIQSKATLNAGNRYLFVVTGTWQYDNRLTDRLADAECTTHEEDPSWDRNRFGRTSPGSDPYDLLVGGQGVEWLADGRTDTSCSASDHRYRTIYTPDTAGTVNLAIFDSYYIDNTGSLTVEIYLIEPAS